MIKWLNKGDDEMKKKLLIIGVISISILFIVGCENTTIKEFNTLSGKPEAVIRNVEQNKIVNLLNNEMIKQGYIIKETTKHKLVYEKDVESLATSVVYGSEYDSTPRYRIILNLVKYETKIRVIGTIKIVTNPGSAYEKTEDITYSKSGGKYHKILKDIKTQLENNM